MTPPRSDGIMPSATGAQNAANPAAPPSLGLLDMYIRQMGVGPGRAGQWIPGFVIGRFFEAGRAQRMQVGFTWTTVRQASHNYCFEYFVYFTYTAYNNICSNSNAFMYSLENVSKPSKEEQEVAMESYSALRAVLDQLRTDKPEIEIEETKERIKVPLSALKLLAQILEATSRGKPVSIVLIAMEMTTQSAADLLGCSRPHLVKLLEEGEIPFFKVGRHRRVKFEDVVAYKKRMKEKQKDLIIKMMQADEESGLYDT